MRIDCYIHLVNDESVLQQILHKVTRIMATQAELAAALTTANDSLTSIGTEVDKIGTETTTLQKQVADLTAALGNVQTTPEVDAALAALQATTATLANRVKTVDDLVPDAPVTP